MKDNKSIINSCLTLLWIIAMLMVFYKIGEYAEPLLEHITEINLLLVLAGLTGGVLFSLPSAWIIHDYFNKYFENHSWGIVTVLAFLPAIGKYIPGKIWVAGSFILHASNLAKIKLSDSLIFQIYYQIIGVAGTIILLIIGYLLGFQIIYSIEVLIAGVIVLISCFSLMIYLLKSMKKFNINMKSDRVVYYILALIMQKILRGLSLIIFVCAFIDVYAHAGSILFAFFISMQIGVLAFFAPAGLGITEGVYMITLSPVLGIEHAILIALLSRIWSTIVDALLAVYALLIKHYRLNVLSEA